MVIIIISNLSPFFLYHLSVLCLFSNQHGIETWNMMPTTSWSSTFWWRAVGSLSVAWHNSIVSCVGISSAWSNTSFLGDVLSSSISLQQVTMDNTTSSICLSGHSKYTASYIHLSGHSSYTASSVSLSGHSNYTASSISLSGHSNYTTSSISLSGHSNYTTSSVCLNTRLPIGAIAATLSHLLVWTSGLS